MYIVKTNSLALYCYLAVAASVSMFNLVATNSQLCGSQETIQGDLVRLQLTLPLYVLRGIHQTCSVLMFGHYQNIVTCYARVGTTNCFVHLGGKKTVELCTCDIKKNLLTFYRLDVGGQHLGLNDTTGRATVEILSFAF